MPIRKIRFRSSAASTYRYYNMDQVEDRALAELTRITSITHDDFLLLKILRTIMTRKNGAVP